MAAQSATELLQGILDSNETYAAAFAQSDSALLKKLAVGQSPRIFWLGCSDSRVSAELSTGVAPGSIFVHRNIAQCFHKGDLSAAAALAYAVHVLKVDAIIVCGHTGCGGVKAGMQAAVDAAEKEAAGEQLEAPAPGSVAETISKWIAPIKSLASTHLPSCEAAHRSPLDALSLAELTDQHVRDTVASVAESDIVRAAWDEGREISVHGWVYHVATAKLRDLDCGWKGVGVRAESLSRPSTYADSEPRED
ncbi:hypothetical protein Rhopal_005044-T1 [Rhodotorula paludigena]|uniref:Carbonic anhydrase n=1 Tax=Rhodotorula paludigena TaxID=86838 RepID=A0AAV5GHE0_9BASI|nr:hypothetical protein Rhopal_005044-T1 [Rhodotorula paludigena]